MSYARVCGGPYIKKTHKRRARKTKSDLVSEQSWAVSYARVCGGPYIKKTHKRRARKTKSDLVSEQSELFVAGFTRHPALSTMSPCLLRRLLRLDIPSPHKI